MSKRVYWLWLTTRDDLGAETIRKLTTSFGTPEFLYGATREQLMQTGLKPRQINALCDKDLSRAEDILRVCEQKKIQIITIEDSAYPDRLREKKERHFCTYLIRWNRFEKSVTMLCG